MAVATLDAKLAALATMSPAQLRAEWERVHRGVAPDVTRELLARGIAHHLQERAYGGLPQTARAELLRLAERACATAGKSGKAAPAVRIKPGTRLTREWQGQAYHVLVLDQGYQHNEQRYPSLTAIARKITGAAWSGPRFFGLVARRGAEKAQ